MLYADDTQLYLALDRENGDESISILESCVRGIKMWMETNKLKLNDSKTEVIQLSSKHRAADPFPGVAVGDVVISKSDSVKDLGVHLDSTLTMKRHVSSVVSAGSNALRKIGKIRKYLDIASTERLVHAFISSRLDYCNSLLCGTSKQQLARLQRLQNTAARLVTCSKRNEHITPILRRLHWLPVEKRITFKVALLTYKSMNNQGPHYISELLSEYRPARSLRSADKLLLVEPHFRTATYGQHAFANIAQRVWNSLPLQLRECATVDSFKKKLKTYLFTLSF
jgi:hypothetical protein